MELGYVLLGTNNLSRAIEFYKSLFKEYNYEWTSHSEWKEDGGFTFPSGKHFGIIVPFNKESARNGNGSMVGFQANTNEEVDKLYKKVLELGGTCEGAPGERFPGFYAAYWRDLDQNKCNFFTYKL